MIRGEPLKERALLWSELPEATRAALARKLEGLYGGLRDETVFDALAFDKQQALLILLRRFLELSLWDAVRRIENLYGEGGVGMNFSAWPNLKSRLESRAGFRTWFARHHNTSGGFIEHGAQGGGAAALHLLYSDGSAAGRKWEAHFDLYNPWTSPLSAWRHLLHEKIRRETPDWRVIQASLGYTQDLA